ncbi:MAG: chitinase [Sphingobacteriia bacterium]|nr:MAG: chitinase [Sphingobacteriia bacterium]
MSIHFKKIVFCSIFLFLGFQSFTQVNSPICKYLNKAAWDSLFPNRYAISTTRSAYSKEVEQKEFYSYASFIQASRRFPDFLKKGTETQKKRELAAFLASMAHETSGGWDDAPGGYFKWGLYFLEERGCENGCTHYSDTTKKKMFPVKGQSYHGRGPLQLSWNYNYAQFSSFYFKDLNKLLRNPSLLSSDPVLCFASAFWFWMTPQYPKPSCHEIMTGIWEPELKDSIAGRLPGFGAVMNVINGGLECGANQSPKTAYRLAYYEYFCKYFNVDPGAACDCKSQRPFGQ